MHARHLAPPLPSGRVGEAQRPSAYMLSASLLSACLLAATLPPAAGAAVAPADPATVHLIPSAAAGLVSGAAGVVSGRAGRR